MRLRNTGMPVLAELGKLPRPAYGEEERCRAMRDNACWVLVEIQKASQRPAGSTRLTRLTMIAKAGAQLSFSKVPAPAGSRGQRLGSLVSLARPCRALPARPVSADVDKLRSFVAGRPLLALVTVERLDNRVV